MESKFKMITRVDQKMIKTRTRADQHKWLPNLACLNPTPLLFLKSVVNSRNNSEIKKKKILLACRARSDESIDV